MPLFTQMNFAHGGGGSHGGGESHGGGGGGHGGGKKKWYSFNLPGPLTIIGLVVLLYLAGLIFIGFAGNFGTKNSSVIASSNDVTNSSGSGFTQPSINNNDAANAQTGVTPPTSGGTAGSYPVGQAMLIHTDNSGPANLRSSAKVIPGNVTTSLANGTKVTLADDKLYPGNGINFYKVNTDSGQGFIAADLLTPAP